MQRRMPKSKRRQLATLRRCSKANPASEKRTMDSHSPISICPACNHPASELATACPHCGFPIVLYTGMARDVAPHCTPQELVSRNPHTPQATLKALSQCDNEDVRSALCDNPSTDESILFQLSHDQSARVRIALASSPFLTIVLMEALADDTSTAVRDALLQNPATPEYIRRELRFQQKSIENREDNSEDSDEDEFEFDIAEGTTEDTKKPVLNGASDAARKIADAIAAAYRRNNSGNSSASSASSAAPVEEAKPAASIITPTSNTSANVDSTHGNTAPMGAKTMDATPTAAIPDLSTEGIVAAFAAIAARKQNDQNIAKKTMAQQQAEQEGVSFPEDPAAR